MRTKYNGRSNIVGVRVREARIEQNLTQAQLDQILQDQGAHFSARSISRIETGKRMVFDFELKLLSKALNKSIKWMYGMEDDPI